ncbi:hypothetical protein HHI36_016720 [Cryptolaemus montrouzieri]|uniref:Kynurenine formamidase n=1 Tax=Cryptolaemus montrouzieri TaxID=559131 RepID=A0ABD2NL90_9CUCU
MGGLSLVLIFHSAIIISGKFITIGAEKIVDLTWTFDNDTINWSGTSSFHYTKKIEGNDLGYWYAMNEFQTGEHCGTHLDAPYHFNKEGWKTNEISVEHLVANGMLVDFSNEVEKFGADYIVNATLLEQKLDALQPIPNNTVLLIKFGWSKYWPNRNKYAGLNQLHFPGLDKSSSTIIVNKKQFVGVGVDTISVDVGTSREFWSHRVLNGHNIYVLENVKLMENLPDKGFRLIVAPMKLGEGTGAPVRIFALLDESSKSNDK